MVSEARAQINHAAYMRKLSSEASTVRVKSNLTVNPARAAFVRCPATGQRFPATSDMGAKCRHLFKT